MSETIRRRGLYSKEQLVAAVGAVLDGEMSAVEVSRMYKVPQGTTRTHANNLALGTGVDRRFYLNSKKEGYLVDLIKALEVIGVRMTKSL